MGPIHIHVSSHPGLWGSPDPSDLPLNTPLRKSWLIMLQQQKCCGGIFHVPIRGSMVNWGRGIGIEDTVGLGIRDELEVIGLDLVIDMRFGLRLRLWSLTTSESYTREP